MQSKNQFAFIVFVVCLVLFFCVSLSYEAQQEYTRRLIREISSEDECSDLEYSVNDPDYVAPPRVNAVVSKRRENMDEAAGPSGKQNDAFEDDSDMELEEVPVEIMDTDSESESEEIEGEATHTVMGRSYFTAKDGTIWNKDLPLNSHTQTRVHNVLRQSPKASTAPETRLLGVVDTFRLIFTSEMCSIIIRETNRRALSAIAKLNADFPVIPIREWNKLTSKEFDAYLAVLILAGVQRSRKENVEDLWKTTSNPLFRASMSISRFRQINRFIRFDNMNTRAERMNESKVAPILDIWLLLNANLRKMYRPSANLTVDEQLFPYRGRTKFTMYMPNKPAKYGIKVWWVCDAETSYPITGQVYSGKSEVRDVNQGERVVRELCSQFAKTGRNVYMDNFFTTLPLARFMMTLQLSIVGTMKKNKPYLPEEFKPSRKRELHSTEFGFLQNENVTLCSYVTKKTPAKAVVLLSTLHFDKAISGNSNN